MGAFIDKYERPDVYIPKHGIRQNCGCINPWAALGIQFGQYTIGGILSGDIKLGGDGKGGSEGKVDKETQKEIDNKKKELTAVYNEAGVSTAEAFNKAVTTQESKVKTIQGELNQIGTVESIQAKIEESQTQLQTATTNKDQKAISTYELQIGELTKKLEEAKRKDNELKQAQVELARLQGLQGKAENIENEILKLQDKPLSTDIKYDVKQETDDLNKFNTALKKFTSIKNDKNHKPKDLKDAAQELMVAYFGGSGEETQNPIVDNKTAQTAFGMIKEQVKAALAAA